MIVFFETAKEAGVNWTAISAVGTILAAISSWIAIFLVYRTNKKNTNLAHAEVKPLFIGNGIRDKRNDGNKEFEIIVVNNGYKDIKGSLVAYWEGDTGIVIENNERIFLKYEKNISFEIALKVNGGNVSERFNGSVFILYRDILGKKYKEKIDVVIENIYSEELDYYVPTILNNIRKPFE